MKLKLIVVDLDLSRRQKRIGAGGLAVALALLVVGVSTYATAVPVEFTAGTTLKADDLNANFEALEAARVVAKSVESTGSVVPNGGIWTTIPGMSVTLTLAQPSLVQATGSGVQRSTDNTSNPNILCHAAYRYVVDGVPKGDATNGQRINVSNGDILHSIWSVVDQNTLAAGEHTIDLQARTNANFGGDCYICAEYDGSQAAWDSCTLNVIAIPQ